MTEYITKIHDLATNEIIERDMNAKEIEALLKAQEEAQREASEAQAKIAQRAAILEKLGLTEDEAKLILS